MASALHVNGHQRDEVRRRPTYRRPFCPRSSGRPATRPRP
jgi:hypothetical protein